VIDPEGSPSPAICSRYARAPYLLTLVSTRPAAGLNYKNCTDFCRLLQKASWREQKTFWRKGKTSWRSTHFFLFGCFGLWSPRNCNSATRTTCLPMLSPENRSRNASGPFSTPSTTESRWTRTA